MRNCRENNFLFSSGSSLDLHITLLCNVMMRFHFRGTSGIWKLSIWPNSKMLYLVRTRIRGSILVLSELTFVKNRTSHTVALINFARNEHTKPTESRCMSYNRRECRL